MGKAMSDQETLARLEEQRRAAFVAADKAALGRLLSDTLILTHTNGMAEGKESFMASLGAKVRFHVVEALEEDIVVLGAMAVVSGRLRVEVQPAGADVLSFQTRITGVWAREGADWRLIRYQATRIV
ncbi:MAG: nuclear transport factor 2 family protein [Hyphomonadaceae bacterium]